MEKHQIKKELLQQMYRTNKYLGYIPLPDDGDENGYRKHGNDEIVMGIYGKGFVFHHGKLSMIYSEEKTKGFERYTGDLWIMLIGRVS